MSDDVMKEIFGGRLRRTGTDTSMKDKCATDFKAFCEYYLKDSFPSPWSSTFHDWLIHKLEDVTLQMSKEETRNVVAAPRGHAKSTLVSFAYPLWCICYNYKKFILIISATGAVAKEFLLNIRTELEFNELIREDFGELKDESGLWNNSEVLTKNKVFLTSKGAGTQIRGLNFNHTRPDLVIVDDLETAESVASPTQNADLHKWFNSDLMPVGAPTCAFFVIGTVLSYSSLLYCMLTKSEYSSWNRKLFKAIITFSNSPKWEKWKQIITDLSRGDHAYSDSVAYYNKHKKEMLEGTEVLWKDQRPNMYRYLMEKYIANAEGFASEYQNDPQTEETRIFKVEWLEGCIYNEHPPIKEVSIAIDPAVSSKRHNDYSAIIAVARCTDNYFYVLDADVEKRSPDKLIDDCRDMIRRYYSYNPKVSCETNQMQAFFSSTLQADMIANGIYIDWNEVFHSTGQSKAGRIESLVPRIRQGHIKFKHSMRVLIDQFKNYPKGHDDAIDALEMALKPLLDTSIAKFSFGSVGEKGGNIHGNIKYDKAFTGVFGRTYNEFASNATVWMD